MLKFREHEGDLWDLAVDAVVITTNGTIKNDGTAVMGRGCAKEAAERIPDLAALLGRRLGVTGNKVYKLVASYPREGMGRNSMILNMPVKHQWYQKADLDLIKKSALDLRVRADQYGLQSLALPRPGCGNGKLDWEEVKPILEEIFDDRFIICRPA